MVLNELDLDALRRWVVAARADLTTHAEALDRLNVFPVPDGDTGSNMRVTVQQAVRALAAESPEDLAEAAALLARAMLISARGNSGVILSQLVAGVGATVQERGGAPLDGAGLARALRAASDRAWAGVARPVEGTILSVAGAAADGAEAVASGSLLEVTTAAADAALQALERTTGQLRVLRNAGVVDAGGAGYLLVLEALLRVVRGRAGLADPDRLAAWLPQSGERPETQPDRSGPAAHASPDGPAYEVMYLLEHSDSERVVGLKEALDALGDSLVVAGGPELWSVHVHTDDVAGALEAGVTAGRPHQFSITRFADATNHQEPAQGNDPRLAAVVSGSGLAELVRRRGGMPVPSSGVAASRLAGLLDGARGVVLCDSEAARAVADEVAAERDDLVVAGRHPAHLVAALDVLDLDAPAADTVEQLAECERDIRALDLDGSPDEVAAQVADQIGDAELLTVVTGSAAAAADAQRVVELLTTACAGVDIVHIDGGSPSPTYAIGVE